jgi:hypothetical protein
VHYYTLLMIHFEPLSMSCEVHTCFIPACAGASTRVKCLETVWASFSISHKGSFQASPGPQAGCARLGSQKALYKCSFLSK